MIIDIIPLPKRPHKEKYVSSNAYQKSFQGGSGGRSVGRTVTWDSNNSIFKYKFIEISGGTVAERIVLSRQPITKNNVFHVGKTPVHIYPISLKRYNKEENSVSHIRFPEYIRVVLGWLGNTKELVTANRLLANEIVAYLHEYPIYPVEQSHVERYQSSNVLDKVSDGDDRVDACTSALFKEEAIEQVSIIQRQYWDSVALSGLVNSTIDEQLNLIHPTDTISKLALCGDGELVLQDLYRFMRSNVRSGTYRDYMDFAPIFELTPEVLYGAPRKLISRFHVVINYLNESPYTDISMECGIGPDGISRVTATNASNYLQFVDSTNDILEPVKEFLISWSRELRPAAMRRVTLEKTNSEELFITVETEALSYYIYFDLVLYSLANYSLVQVGQ